MRLTLFLAALGAALVLSAAGCGSGVSASTPRRSVVRYLAGDSRQLLDHNFDGLAASTAGFLDADGLTLQPVSSITAESLAGADAFFVPILRFEPGNELTPAEIATLRNYVLEGHSVVFNLENRLWQSANHDLFARLGLSGVHQRDDNSGNSGGPFELPNPDHPIIRGPHGVVTPTDTDGFDGFFVQGPMLLDALGPLTSLVNGQTGDSIVALADRGVLGPGSGAVIILGDVYLIGPLNPTYPGGILLRNAFAYAVNAR